MSFSELKSGEMMEYVVEAEEENPQDDSEPGTIQVAGNLITIYYILEKAKIDAELVLDLFSGNCF